MAQQHLARIDLSGLPHRNGGALIAFVGKDGQKLFPTDRDEAHPFRSPRAAARAADKVRRQIEVAASHTH
jgi:hypothetical protein